MNKQKGILCFLIISITCICSGCVKVAPYKTVTYESDYIDETVRHEANQAADLIETTLISGDLDTLKAVTSPGLLAQWDGVSESVKEISSGGIKEVRDIGDYYITKSGEGIGMVSLNFTDGDCSFQMAVPAEYSEEYVRSTVLKTGGLDYLFIHLYTKDEGQWKLITFMSMDYGYFGETPQAMYDKIIKMHKNKDDLTALLYCSILNNIDENDTVTYGFHSDYEKFKSELDTADAQRKLEEMNSGLSAECQIINIDGVLVKEGPAVLVSVVNNDLPLMNEDRLVEKADNIKGQLEAPMADILKNFSFLVIRQYEEIPADPNKTYQYYTHVFKLP